MDTIYALATARGKAGVAIVRLSGPKAFSTVETLSRGAAKRAARSFATSFLE